MKNSHYVSALPSVASPPFLFHVLYTPAVRDVVWTLLRIIWFWGIGMWVWYESHAPSTLFGMRVLERAWVLGIVWGGGALITVVGSYLWSEGRIHQALMGFAIVVDGVILGAIVGCTGVGYSIALLPASIFVIALIMLGRFWGIGLGLSAVVLGAGLSHIFLGNMMMPVLDADYHVSWAGFGIAVLAIASGGLRWYMHNAVRLGWIAHLEKYTQMHLRLSALDAQPVGVMVCDDAGEIYFVNTALLPYIQSLMQRGNNLFAWGSNWGDARAVSQLAFTPITLTKADSQQKHVFHVRVSPWHGAPVPGNLYILIWLDMTLEKISEWNRVQEGKWRALGHFLQHWEHHIQPALDLFLQHISQEKDRDVMQTQVYALLTKEAQRIEEWRNRLHSVLDTSLGLQKKSEDVLFLCTTFYERAVTHPLLRSEGIPLWVHNRITSDAQVSVDRDAMLEALGHLFDNAVEATAETQHAEGVTFESEMAGGSEVIFRIKDQAGSLTEELLTSAIEPFVTTKSNHLGIGLSHAYRIIRAHGGTLYLYQEGPETIAEVRLPVTLIPPSS